MQKLTKQQINAVAHNLILEEVLVSAWEFVCSLAPTNEWEYAFTNSAAEDYMDTIWQTTQNVTMGTSLMLYDAKTMYDAAYSNYESLLNVNLAELTVGKVYEAMDDISGDTAMREEYYGTLREHFLNFVKANPLYKLEETEYRGHYVLTSTHSQAQKNKLVHDYCSRWDAYEYVELNNELA